MQSSPQIHRGTVLVEVPANPAAGADFVYSPPLYTFAKVEAISYTLVTDANVANRYPGIQISYPPGYTIYHTPGTVITAGLTSIITLWVGGPQTPSFVANRYTGSLPDNLWLEQGVTLSSEIRQIQVGDAITNVRLLLRRWADPND